MLKVIGLDKDTKSYAPSYIYTAIDTKCKAIHLAKDAQGDLPYLKMQYARQFAPQKKLKG